MWHCQPWHVGEFMGLQQHTMMTPHNFNPFQEIAFEHKGQPNLRNTDKLPVLVI